MGERESCSGHNPMSLTALSKTIVNLGIIKLVLEYGRWTKYTLIWADLLDEPGISWCYKNVFQLKIIHNVQSSLVCQVWLIVEGT